MWLCHWVSIFWCFERTRYFLFQGSVWRRPCHSSPCNWFWPSLFTRPLIMKAIYLSGTSGATCPATHRHVPEDSTFQSYHSVNLETGKFCVLWGVEVGDAGMCSKPNILFELHISSGLWSGGNFWRSTAEVQPSLHMGPICQSTKRNSGVIIIHICYIISTLCSPSAGCYSHACPDFHLSINLIVNIMSYHDQKT